MREHSGSYTIHARLARSSDDSAAPSEPHSRWHTGYGVRAPRQEFGSDAFPPPAATMMGVRLSTGSLTSLPAMTMPTAIKINMTKMIKNEGPRTSGKRRKATTESTNVTRKKTSIVLSGCRKLKWNSTHVAVHTANVMAAIRFMVTAFCCIFSAFMSNVLYSSCSLWRWSSNAECLLEMSPGNILWRSRARCTSSAVACASPALLPIPKERTATTTSLATNTSARSMAETSMPCT
mmetsp:Transcript_100432/g.284543  ORF Transcript_100432/g.284543 Transcript_100432/m.284543 type:complete len:235 (-) Transcript_100432:172-876(-)